MSNPHKGELSFATGGKTFTFVFSINAVCALEDELGMGVNAIAAMLSDPKQMRLGLMRSLFRCGLSDNHPDVDDAEAGRLMSALGAADAMRLVGDAFRLAFPAEEHDSVPPQQPTSATVTTSHPRGNGSIS